MNRAHRSRHGVGGCVWLSMLQAQGLPVEGRCLAGLPVETILGEAARWEADVVIVGTAGRRGRSRLMLGSVAEGVIRRAGCPVLVVGAAVSRKQPRHRGRS